MTVFSGSDLLKVNFVVAKHFGGRQPSQSRIKKMFPDFAPDMMEVVEYGMSDPRHAWDLFWLGYFTSCESTGRDFNDHDHLRDYAEAIGVVGGAFVRTSGPINLDEFGLFHKRDQERLVTLMENTEQGDIVFVFKFSGSSEGVCFTHHSDLSVLRGRVLNTYTAGFAARGSNAIH